MSGDEERQMGAVELWENICSALAPMQAMYPASYDKILDLVARYGEVMHDEGFWTPSDDGPGVPTWMEDAQSQ